MLDQIKEKLTDLLTDTEVPMAGAHYGLVPRFVKSNGAVEYPSPLNRFVFRRTTVDSNGNGNCTKYTERYIVTVFHEDYVPEDYIYKVINKVLEIKALKVSESEQIEYDYTYVGNTEKIVELATITFKRRERTA